MNSQYQKVYGVGLLDDIHNYFPLILYEPERFISVQDILGYIRQNTRSRFNLYEAGRRQYRQVPQNTFINRGVVESELEIDIASAAELSILFPLLRSINIPQPRQRTSLFQDVIIHATQGIINRGSTVRTLLTGLDGSCSICQDSMRQGQNIRKLNTCQHEFHSECIDNWLLHRSVLCPICRHDIRPQTDLSNESSPIEPPVSSGHRQRES
jgi:hypothetical protein